MDIPKEIEEKIKAPKVEEIEIKAEEIKEEKEIKDISADFENTLKENAQKEDFKEEEKEILESAEDEEIINDFENDTNYLPFIIGGGALLIFGLGALVYFGKDNISENLETSVKEVDAWTN